MRLVICCAGAMLLVHGAAAQASATVRYPVSSSAVAAALAQAGLPVAPERVRLPGAVSARVETPELQVTGAGQRPNGALAVRISCRNSPDCMPFFVTVDAGEDHDALAAFAARAWAPTAPAAVPASLKGVAAGTHLQLELADAQMRIVLPVIAIDTGAPGAEVRVASLDRKHTWRGVVVDETTVRGGLQ